MICSIVRKRECMITFSVCVIWIFQLALTWKLRITSVMLWAQGICLSSVGLFCGKCQGYRIVMAVSCVVSFTLQLTNGMASPCTCPQKNPPPSLTGDLPWVSAAGLALILILVNKQRVNLRAFAICNSVCWFPSRQSWGWIHFQLNMLLRNRIY